MEEKIEKPTLGQLWQDIKKHKKLYYKVLCITFILSAIIMLSIPNYYKCTVMLAPEMSGAKSGGALSGLASSFGINLGGANAGADAIVPTHYPDLMNSVTFRASLFPIKIQREGESGSMTYYEYLKDCQKTPWWSEVTNGTLNWISSLFSSDRTDTDTIGLNIFRLTEEQSAVIAQIGAKVVCNVDNRTNVITIDVTDQDPLVAATMADSVQKHLQAFITDYRTSKARIDLAYNQKLYKESKARYEEARKRYANFSDANRNVLFENKRSERAELENEMQLQYRTYSQIAAQLQLAEAKVQEETPAFTILQPATVPIHKNGPQRKRNILVFIVLALLATTFYAIHKEGHLLPLLKPSHRAEDDFDELTLTDLVHFLNSDKK